MKAQIIDGVSTGDYWLHFTAEDAAEEFFLSLLVEKDGEVFSPIHNDEGERTGVGVSVPKPHKREAKTRANIISSVSIGSVS